MRDMRPLLLPKLVAARNSAASINDDLTSANHSVLSYDSAYCSYSSECSTPMTPTFSLRGHARYPSSSSSLSSTSPSSEGMDGKLPKLSEEPTEKDDGFAMVREETTLAPCLCDVDVCAHQSTPSSRSTGTSSTAKSAFSDDMFSGDAELAFQRLPKRRRSGESPLDSLTTRLGRRLPSLSGRWKDRKSKSTLAAQGNRNYTPSRAQSSRSSSITDSFFAGFDQAESQHSLAAFRNNSSPSEEPVSSLPLEISVPASSEPIDRQALASTPLLPPVMISTRPTEELPVQSPLQSPTVANSSTLFSAVDTPAAMPQHPRLSSPPLSTKPSLASFHPSRPGLVIPTSEIPPIMIADPTDEWAIKLGHANFTIDPEPYVPQVCDTNACHRLFADWEQARINFSKHLVRTSDHFGATSKTYMLTQEKWAAIDAQWKRNNDLVAAKVAETSQDAAPITPTEPAPLVKLPSLNDPKGEGKFPKLGDEDIVGPMVQLAARVQCKPSRRVAFSKVFASLKFPGVLLGRSPATVHTRR